MIAVSIVFLSTAIASNGIDTLHTQKDEWQNKPLQVNIQIDVEGKHDQEYINSILNKIESHGWITSVFVTGKFASEYPDFIQEIENRGHYIGIYGWDKENLSSLNYLQQLEIINKSIFAVKRAVRIPRYIVDFKPQNLDYNDDTIRILQELGMNSITGYFDANETFVKCPYAKKVGKVTFPYPVTTEFSAVPLSDVMVEDQEVLIDDNLQIKSSPDNYYNYLKNEYDEHNKTREPMVFSLSPSNMNGKKLQSLSKFLDYIDKKGGKVKPTAPMTILASYIPYLQITSAPESACDEETINITISFSAAISCPNYYFRIYGKYPGDKDWKYLNSYVHKVKVGTFSFSKFFKIPKPTGDDSSYIIRAVGQACSGVCWPTQDNYERRDEVSILIMCPKITEVSSYENIKIRDDYGDITNPIWSVENPSQYKPIADNSDSQYFTIDVKIKSEPKPTWEPKVKGNCRISPNYGFLQEPCKFMALVETSDGWIAKFKVATPNRVGKYSLTMYLTLLDDKGRVRDNPPAMEHTLYVTLKEPEHEVSPPKEIWLDNAVKWAEGAKSENEVTGKLVEGIYSTSWAYDPNLPFEWYVLKETTPHIGNCLSFATLWKNMAKVLGVNKKSASIYGEYIIKDATDQVISYNLYPDNRAVFTTKNLRSLDGQQKEWRFSFHQVGSNGGFFDPVLNMKGQRENYEKDLIKKFDFDAKFRYNSTQDSYNRIVIDGANLQALIDAKQVSGTFVFMGKNYKYIVNLKDGASQFHDPEINATITPANDTVISVDKISYDLNEPILIKGAIIRNGFAVNGLSFFVEIQAPYGNFNISLYDDGTHGDIQSKDGIYSYKFINTSQEGGYGIISRANGTIDGQPFYDEVILPNGILVTSIGARFLDFYSDEGVDTDSNGLFNFLKSVVTLNVTNEGDYTITGRIKSNNTEMGESGKILHIPLGIYNVTLNFDATSIRSSGMDGPYLLEVSLVDKDSDQIGYKEFNTSSYSYAQFERLSAGFTGIYSDYRSDTDGNGLYNYLTIQLGVNVTVVGNYTLVGILYDTNGDSIAWDYNNSQLSAGIRPLILNFDGISIFNHNINGPYTIGITLFDKTGTKIGYQEGITSAYSYTDFEKPIINFTGNFYDHGVDDNGDSFYDDLVVEVELYVAKAGNYSDSALLYVNDTPITYTDFFGYLYQGTQIINLEFDGFEIYEKGKNGPYTLKYVTFFTDTGITANYELDIYNTSSYNYTKFYGGGTIHGFVKNISGATVPNVSMVVDGPTVASTLTDASGRYSLIGLETGSYVIYAEPVTPNLMTASANINIIAGQILEQNFTLQLAGSIAGNITDINGNGIPNLIIYLSGYETARYRTDENGYYLIPRLQSGNYTLNVDASETEFKDNKTNVAVNLGETTIANFVLARPDGGNLTGIISYVNGTGIYNAKIEASGPSFKYALSNETGHYRITGLEAGQYILRVQPPYQSNLSYFITHLNITTGKTTYLNITLEKEKSISVIEGYVSDTSYIALSNVPVAIESYYETSRFFNKTNANGYFVFKNLRSGIYNLDINYPDMYPSIDNYTMIGFRDENLITIAEYLQVNVTLPKIGLEINFNISYFKENDTVQLNLTATNKEGFDLVNWLLSIEIISEDKLGYKQELYKTEILTNLSAFQTKSFLSTFKIPQSSGFQTIYVRSELKSKSWPVKSSEGDLTANIRKEAKKEIHTGTDDDIDGDGILNQDDNCPYNYNPNQEDVVYAYDDFNDNMLYDWYGVTADPAITLSETNGEIRIYGTASQQSWNYLNYNIWSQRYVEASIEVKTPKLDENAVFSFALGRLGPKWGYYRIMRTKDSYRVSGQLEGEEYWDSGEMYYLFGDEGTNFHTYKIIYNKPEQKASFFIDDTHLYTKRNINFELFLFSLIWEGWASGAQLDVRVDNFTVKQTGDIDNDLIGDVCDNCVYSYNPGQEDSDSGGIGDACDNCWYSINPAQLDSDLDCPLPPYSSNPQCGDACEFTFEIPLKKGWGLISSPLNFTNIAETFDPIKPYLVSIFTYDAKLQKFVEVDPFSQEIDLRYGVWVKVNNSVVLIITGEQFGSTSILLFQGWNLVGYPYLEEKNVADLYVNNVVYSYNGSWSSYIPDRTFNSLQTLKPGYGYWVKK